MAEMGNYSQGITQQVRCVQTGEVGEARKGKLAVRLRDDDMVELPSWNQPCGSASSADLIGQNFMLRLHANELQISTANSQSRPTFSLSKVKLHLQDLPVCKRLYTGL